MLERVFLQLLTWLAILFFSYIISVIFHIASGYPITNLFLFIFPSFAIYYFHSIDKQESIRNNIRLIVRRHAPDLAVKRQQLVIKLNYDLLDYSRWIKEMDFFIVHIILPNVSGKFTYPELRDIINEEVAKIPLKTPGYSSSMDPLEYEVLVSNKLTSFGWNARTTRATGDQGIDVIAEKAGKKVVLQCKLYTSPVGNKAVQEIISGKIFEQADFAAVVTNSTFTASAKQLAGSSGVFLLHHEELSKLDSLCSTG